MSLSRFVIIGMAIICLPGPALGGKDYHFEYQKIINIEPPLELTITNPHGTVVVKPTYDDKITIDATKNIYAESHEEAELISDHVQMSVTTAERHIRVEPEYRKIQNRSPSFWDKLLGKSGEASYGTINFVISVPADCNLEIANPEGFVSVTGLRGSVDVTANIGGVEIGDILGDISVVTSSGDITVTDVEGAVMVKANGGDVSFVSISGDLEIRNSAGRTTGEYLIGDLTLTQQGGEIEVAHIEGDMRIKTTSATVFAGQDFGAVDVSTESGDIEITTALNSPKDYFVETVSGSIRFLVPEASGGEVDLEAGSCEIDTQIPIAIDSFSRTRISGRFGNRGPNISLVTTSGEIILGEY